MPAFSEALAALRHLRPGDVLLVLVIALSVGACVWPSGLPDGPMSFDLSPGR